MMRSLSDDERYARILHSIRTLVSAYKNGELGGEVMPEDTNPNLLTSSAENYMFFTLPMALNYQRNSYSLWEAATYTYNDSQTTWVFNPTRVIESTFSQLQDALTKYKTALQKNKQTEIWMRLCKTFVKEWVGDVRNLLITNNNNVKHIKECIISNKKDYPYLSGNKILNYWLYVI